MKNLFNSLLVGLLLMSCGGRNPNMSQKQLAALMNDTILVNQQEKPEKLSFNTPTGIKHIENRKVDQSNFPAIIDLSKLDLPTKLLDANQLFNSVEYTILKHPLADSGMFLCDASVRRQYSKSIASMTTSTRVSFIDHYIITSDIFGIYCFNADGSFSHAICKNEFNCEINPKENTIVVDMTSFKGYDGSTCISNNHTIAYTYLNYVESEVKSIFHDLQSKESSGFNYQQGQVVPRNIIMNNNFGISEYETLYNYPIMLRSFGLQGDTLCEFHNNEIIIEFPKKNYPSPLNNIAYFFNSTFTYNHAHNDTIFRMTDTNRLTPVYVVNWGNYNTDINEYIHQKATGKLVLRNLKETPGHILLSYYLQNAKTPSYFYAVYEKQTKQANLHKKINNWEKVLVNNSLPNGIPFYFDDLQANNGKYIVSFTKEKLNQILQLNLPETIKQAILQQNEKLNNNEILLMFLK